MSNTVDTTEVEAQVKTRSPKRERVSMEFREGRISTGMYKQMLATTKSPEARKVMKNICLGEDLVAYRKGGRRVDRVKKMRDAGAKKS